MTETNYTRPLSDDDFANIRLGDMLDGEIVESIFREFNDVSGTIPRCTIKTVPFQ